MKEFKKNSKKFNLQVIDLEKKLKEETTEKEKLKEQLGQQSAEIQSKLTDENKENSTKDFELSTKNVEIKELHEHIEQHLKELEDLRTELSELQDQKKNLQNQYNIIQEKRETGIKEIQRLNGVIENLKLNTLHSPMTHSWGGITSPAVLNKSEEQTPKSSQVADHENMSDSKKLGSVLGYSMTKSQTVHWQSQTPQTPGAQGGSTPNIGKIINFIREIKKYVEGLYKDLIEVITSEEFESLVTSQSTREKDLNVSKSTAKDSIIVPNNIPEKFLKLEKKVNDTLSHVQDYIWYLEEKYPNA